MKQLKTLLREAQEDWQDNVFAYYVSECVSRRVSRPVYRRACIDAGATEASAEAWLREGYQKAGLLHLY